MPTALERFTGSRRIQKRASGESFVISEPADLDQEFVYAKERRLIQEIKDELANGRKVQVFAVYTQKRDVTRRLQGLLQKEGIRTEVLTAQTPPEQREAWYERQLRKKGRFAFRIPPLYVRGSIIRIPLHFLRSNGLFDLHLASSQPTKLAHRPERGGASCLFHIFADGTGKLSAGSEWGVVC